MADVLYVIRHLPSSDAATLRCASIIRLFKSCGMSVDLMSTLMVPAESDLEDPSIGASQLILPPALALTSKIKRHVELTTGNRASRAICQYIDSENPKIILFYGGTSTLVSRIARFARSKGILVFVDETDWFKPDAKMNIYSRIYYTLDNRRIEKVDPKVDGQIVISPYFKKYFQDRGTEPFFLPPCVKKLPLVDGICPQPSVVYAGVPGANKDILLPFIKAMVDYRRECANAGRKSKLTLDVVGPSLEYVCNEMGVTESELRFAGIMCHGRLTHDETLKYVKRNSFGLLLRRPALYARAGFSTKFVEYMSCGTAPICNAVGGADLLVDDGVTGIVLGPNACEGNALFELVKTLDGLSAESIKKMCNAAREKAAALFIESSYEEGFRNFLSSRLKQ